MAVETEGKITIKGDESPGVTVHIVAGDHQLTLFIADEVFARFEIPDLRVSALSEGFAIRAEGEDFVLTADDDVGLAEELGVAAASPRLARKMAMAHNTPEVPRPESPPPVRSQVGAGVFGVAGLLVIAGGTFLQTATPQTSPVEDLWLLFIIAGTVMIGVAWLMTLGRLWPQALALAVLTGIAVMFAVGVQGAGDDTTRITAFGFVAGGLVLGAAGAATAHSSR